jgi:hypothetical protein
MKVYVLQVANAAQGPKILGVYSDPAAAERVFAEFEYDYDEADLMFDTRSHSITEFTVDA